MTVDLGTLLIACAVSALTIVVGLAFRQQHRDLASALVNMRAATEACVRAAEAAQAIAGDLRDWTRRQGTPAQ